MRATGVPPRRPSPVAAVAAANGHTVINSAPRHHQRGGDRRRPAPIAMAGADDRQDAANAQPPPPPPPPPYGPPLAADARLVVKDASLGVTARVVGERLAHRRYLATFDRLVRFTRPAGPAAVPAEEVGSAAPAPPNAGGDKDEGAQQHHQDVSYDVIGHPRCEFRFAVVFPYHPPPPPRQKKGDDEDADANADANANADDKGDDEGDVTLVREYAHGPHRFLYSLPSGQFERDKHGDGGLLATARAELEEEARLEGGEWHPLLPAGHPGIPEVKWCANAFEPFLCVGPEPHPCPAARDGEEEAAGLEAVRVPLREFRRLAANGEVLLPSVAAGWMAMERLRELGLINGGR